MYYIQRGFLLIFYPNNMLLVSTPASPVPLSFNVVQSDWQLNSFYVSFTL